MAEPILSFREIATDALRYWERRRVIFNALLLVVYVCTHLLLAGMRFNSAGASGAIEFLYWLVGLAVLCVLANLCYTVVYPIDLFVQASDYRPLWLRFRWMLFAAGALFASCLAGVWASLFSAARLLAPA